MEEPTQGTSKETCYNENSVADPVTMMTISQEIITLKETINSLMKRPHPEPSGEEVLNPRKKRKVECDMDIGWDDFDNLSRVSGSVSEEGEVSDEDDTLNELESFYGAQKLKGAKIDDKLARVVDSGLTKCSPCENKLKEVCERYPAPENTKNILVPKTNPEIWKLLNKGQRVRDARLQKTQSLVTKSITASVGLLNTVRCTRKSGGKPDLKNMENVLTDIVRLTSACFADINSLRKEGMKSGLSDQYKPLCSKSEEGESNELLFGENLADRIRDLGESSKMVNKLQFQPKNFNGGRPFRKGNFFQQPKADPTQRRHYQSQREKKPFYKQNQGWKNRQQKQ